MSNELVHHGRQGQKWGVRNGPPYPLSRQGITGKEYNKRTSTRSTNKYGRGNSEAEYENPAVKRRLNRLSQITKKMEKGQKKADKANLKTAKEKSKTLFRNEEKISKASAKSDKLNAKQEKLFLEGKKEFEKLFKEMYEDKMLVESLSEEHQYIFNKWADAIDKDTPINNFKPLYDKDARDMNESEVNLRQKQIDKELKFVDKFPMTDAYAENLYTQKVELDYRKAELKKEREQKKKHK